MKFAVSSLVLAGALAGSVFDIDWTSPTNYQCALLNWGEFKPVINEKIAEQWDQLPSSNKEHLLDSGALDAHHRIAEAPTIEQLVVLDKYLGNTFKVYAFFLIRHCMENPPSFIPKSSASRFAFGNMAWPAALVSSLAALY